MLTLTRSLLLNKHLAFKNSPKQKMLENKLFSRTFHTSSATSIILEKVSFASLTP